MKEEPTLNEIRNSLINNMNGLISCKDIIIDSFKDEVNFLKARIASQDESIQRLNNVIDSTQVINELLQKRIKELEGKYEN